MRCTNFSILNFNRSTKKHSFCLGGWGKFHKRPMFNGGTYSVTVSVIVKSLCFFGGHQWGVCTRFILEITPL